MLNFNAFNVFKGFKDIKIDSCAQLVSCYLLHDTWYMSVNAKIIRRRVKSIISTKKITKAMELVAAAKMRKAVNAALATRPYAVLAQEMLSRLSLMQNLRALPLMNIRPVKKVLMLIIASNKGLCGGLNTNVFKKAVEQVRQPELLAIQRILGKEMRPAPGAKIEIEAMAIGRRGEKMLKKMGLKIIASFTNLSDRPMMVELTPIAKIIEEEFVKKIYDKVVVIYTDFISALSQKPKIRQLLPVSRLDLEKMLKEISALPSPDKMEKEKVGAIDFIFEPDPRAILTVMLPRLLRIQIYQAMLESTASEHSARMMAMRNASEAAEDMIGDLTFTLNQARQAVITRELAEISGGAAALEWSV